MSQSPRFLTVLPVFNEELTVNGVLDLVAQYADDVLVVDDGSTDGTSALLANRDDIILHSHEVNQGYGACLLYTSPSPRDKRQSRMPSSA